MKIKSEKTREVDARTNQKVEKLQFDVNSHDEYLRLREQFSDMPRIPTLLHVDEAPVTTAPIKVETPDRNAVKTASRNAYIGLPCW
jgi:hypothetical protein